MSAYGTARLDTLRQPTIEAFPSRPARAPTTIVVPNNVGHQRNESNEGSVPATLRYASSLCGKPSPIHSPKRVDHTEYDIRIYWNCRRRLVLVVDTQRDQTNALGMAASLLLWQNVKGFGVIVHQYYKPTTRKYSTPHT
jgi:hypothetical protein